MEQAIHGYTYLLEKYTDLNTKHETLEKEVSNIHDLITRFDQNFKWIKGITTSGLLVMLVQLYLTSR